MTPSAPESLSKNREGVCWSRQELPGKPTAMTFWVHGNDSTDQLMVYFEDRINHALPGWDRTAGRTESRRSG